MEKKDRWHVYGVRRTGGAGRDGGSIEFKMVVPGSTAEQILVGPEIPLVDVMLSDDFADLSRDGVMRWVAYLLAAVPGFDDATTKWAPVPDRKP
ncbi:hypothetical protein ONZ43_g3961 [Nemania bipapillata]|uniref:Uncharacterized protein n=1 Tax=Nemania bipapillata TaxID=110536 RepID=A0ACC2ITX7_9PEZI|nr:hypothetical protein ONZ43_g3961 [Nemania bipapillata]